MKISAYSIQQLSETIKDYLSGSKWVSFFNQLGFREDVYDNALPDVGKPNKQRPSKKEYLRIRLNECNNNNRIQEALIGIGSLENAEIPLINNILKYDKIQCVLSDKGIFIDGAEVNVDKNAEIVAQFYNNESRILSHLDNAKVSIVVMMAWFTNQKIANKLIEKFNEGLDVKVAIYRDGVNARFGVNLGPIPVLQLRGSRGGIMHNKFCVIDNQTVITGSYNWSEAAECKNDENVVVVKDNATATKYSVIFRELCNKNEIQ